MIAQIDKLQVKRQFSRAAGSYDGAANIQYQMSDQLQQMLMEHCDDTPATIIDFGCGTGYSLGQFANCFPKAALTGLDLSETMLDLAAQRLPQASFICGDMETFRPKQSFDLLFSNASIQWCDLEAVLQSANCTLKSQGLLAYSSFGPGTHKEITRAWKQAEPASVHSIEFHSLQYHLDKLEQAGFEVLSSSSELMQPRFSSVGSLLSSIKKTGATNAAIKRDRGLMSRSAFTRFIEHLEKQSPLALSYEAFGFVVRNVD